MLCELCRVRVGGLVDVHREGACRGVFVAAGAQGSGAEHRESGVSERRVSTGTRARAGARGQSGNVFGGVVVVGGGGGGGVGVVVVVVVAVVVVIVWNGTTPGGGESRDGDSDSDSGYIDRHSLTSKGVWLRGGENGEDAEVGQVTSVLGVGESGGGCGWGN